MDSRDPATGTRRVVDRVYSAYDTLLRDNGLGRWFHHLNAGWLPDPDDPGFLDDGGNRTVHVPRRLLNRESGSLVAEVLADEPVAGRRVLDVGCGRGGTLALLAAAPGGAPRVLMGLDLTAACLSAAASVARSAVLVRGDAESLPLPAGSVDVVVNIESSIHYPRVDAFLLEVARVLAPGGALCWADLLVGPERDAWRRAVAWCGLEVEVERDLTAGVARAHERRLSRHGSRPVAPGGATAGPSAGSWSTPSIDADGPERYVAIRARRGDLPLPTTREPLPADVDRVLQMRSRRWTDLVVPGSGT